MLALREMDLPPAPPSLPAALGELGQLIRRQIAGDLIPGLRDRAEAARRFAASRRAWAQLIEAWPRGLDPDIARAAMQRQLVVSRLLDLERDDERRLYPLLWKLEEQRSKIERYPAEMRAAWLGFIDPMIAGIREPLDAIRATRISLQEAEGVGLGRAASDSTELDQRAAHGYKIIADEVFETESTIKTEIVAGERFYIIDIPVNDPAASQKDKEDRVHVAIEGLAPEIVGRVVLRYVPARGAA